MKIDGYTRTCGLIGNPVEHTMSPLIQNTLAQKTGVNLVYVPFHVETGNLRQAVEGGFALNLLGMNVTIPYKEEVIPFLSDIDPLAKRIGAVNTLVRQEDGYKGYNTDMPGLYRAMVSDGISLKGEKVLILGGGGVARAVGMMLAEKEVDSILFINRSVEKIQKIADELNGYAGRALVKTMALSDVAKLEGEDYIAIQATNVGMYPKTEEVLIEEEAFYRKVKVGYDLIFNPKETSFMKQLLKIGKPAYNGSKMLLYQGVIAYELWTGKSVSEEDLSEIYGKMCEEVS